MDREAAVEKENVGRVSYRRRGGDSSFLPGAFFDSPRGTARNAYAHPFSSFRPEDGMAQSPNPLRPGSPLSEADSMLPDLDTGAIPPDSAATANDDSLFKSWLTTGILDILGTAAGMTLSTTGKLVAPPLHMTKTILLPGLLALMVETLDLITPPRVKDWFRILSSSLYHLMTVLGSTEKGNAFSSQVYVVLQDIMHALSAPESRQVLVDLMATSIKFAAALHTPEMFEFLEQLSTLAIRLVDAASSGKAKQLMQDTRDMTWKGIEMATDPATTLALAEVTAHICHALEDTQQALNPTPRKQRNAQNQSVYLNPYQMADFPEQVTMEEVILSCLGQVIDHGREVTGDDAASLPSRLTLDDDLSLPETSNQAWKDRKERVNVHLLKEKILNEDKAKSRFVKPTPRLVVPLVDESSAINEGVGELAEMTDESITVKPIVSTQILLEEDVEDIAWSAVPGGRRLGIQPGEKANKSTNKAPAIQQFYERLDELLEKDRQHLQRLRDSTINNPLERDDDDSNPVNMWKAKMKKLKGRQGSTVLKRHAMKKPLNFNRLPKKCNGFISALLTAGALLSAVFFGLAIYGVYALVTRNSPFSAGSKNHILPSSLNQEIVIRIIRETVHVTKNGEEIGESRPSVLTKEQLEEFGQNFAALLR